MAVKGIAGVAFWHLGIQDCIGWRRGILRYLVMLVMKGPLAFIQTKRLANYKYRLPVSLVYLHLFLAIWHSGRFADGFWLSPLAFYSHVCSHCHEVIKLAIAALGQPANANA